MKRREVKKGKQKGLREREERDRKKEGGESSKKYCK